MKAYSDFAELIACESMKPLFYDSKPDIQLKRNFAMSQGPVLAKRKSILCFIFL